MDSERNAIFFELPEYIREAMKFTYISVNELVRRKDPIISKIPVVEHDEIPTTQYSLPSGETLELKPFEASAEAKIPTEDILNGDLESYYICIDTIAEKLLPQLRQQFFQHINKVCDAYGQTVDAEGQPLSYELLMQLLEKKQMEFDENGNIGEGEMLVLNPLTIEQLKKLPPMTVEQEKAWSDLMERKRQEFNARKRIRKLS